MRSLPRPTERPARAEPSAPPKLPVTMRVTVEADEYDALLALARREIRRPEWQAAFLLRNAIAEAMREAADAA